MEQLDLWIKQSNANFWTFHLGLIVVVAVLVVSAAFALKKLFPR